MHIIEIQSCSFLPIRPTHNPHRGGNSRSPGKHDRKTIARHPDTSDNLRSSPLIRLKRHQLMIRKETTLPQCPLGVSASIPLRFELKLLLVRLGCKWEALFVDELDGEAGGEAGDDLWSGASLN